MAIKGKSRFRKIIGWLHLWLGLASGIVVLIVSLTGCLFVFQEEISDIWYRKAFFVKPEVERSVTLSVMQQKAQAVLGSSKPVLNIVTYPQPDRAWEFMTYRENESAATYFGELEYFESVFINPHNGEVTGIRNYKKDFFNIVKSIHWSLLLSTRFGQPIVGWGTLIFVILLITGLVLWYPKKWNRVTRQQAFKIKWKAGIKRLNYDLHNVPGFYSMLLALILALTGMVFSFTWFEKLVYTVASGSTAPPPVEKEVKSDSVSKSAASLLPMDIAFSSAREALSDAQRIGITPAGDPSSTINFYGFKTSGVYYNYDEVKYDQYSGKFLSRHNDSEKNRGEKLLSMNYDIHVGAIGGLAGKIIAFIVSLVCASLPVTGFIVWWHKRKKPSSSTRRSAAQHLSVQHSLPG